MVVLELLVGALAEVVVLARLPQSSSHFLASSHVSDTVEGSRSHSNFSWKPGMVIGIVEVKVSDN